MSGSDTQSDSASSAGDLIEDASDEEQETFLCVFCKAEVNKVDLLFTHCKEAHGFNLLAAVKKAGSSGDDLATFKLINYLRLQDPLCTNLRDFQVTADALDDERLLKPVLEDDALLHSLGDYITPAADERTTQYEDYEAFLDKKLGDIDIQKEALLSADSYFESYKGASIHREMIEDRVRTESYKRFIEKFAHVFRDKVVLDVGCGTGILSLFCARVGAKKVFAVDNSDIATKAKTNVEKNHYSSVVEVIQGRVEDEFVRRKIGKKSVDVIVSEWMGYGLLYEGMLDSVLVARDHYLKEGGVMAPSHCTMLIAPISDPKWTAEETGEAFWKDVYGFDFSAMLPSTALNDKDIAVLDVPKDSMSAEPAGFYILDLGCMKPGEVEFTAPFSTKVDRDVDGINAFTIYFDTFFFPPELDIRSTFPQSARKNTLLEAKAVTLCEQKEAGVAFSTGPASTTTHWHQAVLLVGKEDRSYALKSADVIEGTVKYKKARRNERGIEVEIKWKDKHGERTVTKSME